MFDVEEKGGGEYEGFMFYIMKLVECFIAFKFHSYPSCLQWYFNLL